MYTLEQLEELAKTKGLEVVFYSDTNKLKGYELAEDNGGDDMLVFEQGFMNKAMTLRLAQQLGIKTITTYRTIKNYWNVDGSKRGYRTKEDK